MTQNRFKLQEDIYELMEKIENLNGKIAKIEKKLSNEHGELPEKPVDFKSL
ncbi:MAG: hypothetical protein ACTSVU_07345 [Promethearchaeota archaeon]